MILCISLINKNVTIIIFNLSFHPNLPTQKNLRDVSIRVQPESFRRVSGGHVIDILVVLSHLHALGDDIALVEAECWGEHGLAEPHLAEGVEQTLVKVICHTAAILDFSQHVAHTRPVDSLGDGREM